MHTKPQRKRRSTKRVPNRSLAATVAAAAASLRDFLGYLETRRLNLRSALARPLASGRGESRLLTPGFQSR